MPLLMIIFYCEQKTLKTPGVTSCLLIYVQVYKGYVDDPRNTDNAWMETVAMNFHDEDGSSVGQLKLQVRLTRRIFIPKHLNKI